MGWGGTQLPLSVWVFITELSYKDGWMNFHLVSVSRILLNTTEAQSLLRVQNWKLWAVTMQKGDALHESHPLATWSDAKRIRYLEISRQVPCTMLRFPDAVLSM